MRWSAGRVRMLCNNGSGIASPGDWTSDQTARTVEVIHVREI